MNPATCVAFGLCPIEALEPGQHWAIRLADARHLIRYAGYAPSMGFPFWAEHYRRGLPDGSSLHLVILNGRSTLHRDRYDAHRDLPSLIKHLAIDAPGETLLTVLGAVALGAIVGAVAR